MEFPFTSHTKLVRSYVPALQRQSIHTHYMKFFICNFSVLFLIIYLTMYLYPNHLMNIYVIVQGISYYFLRLLLTLFQLWLWGITHILVWFRGCLFLCSLFLSSLFSDTTRCYRFTLTNPVWSPESAVSSSSDYFFWRTIFKTRT